MSVLRQLNVLGNMRIDVPHIRSIESSIAADFDVVVGRATAGDKPIIIRGLTLANASVGNSPTDAQLITADSIVYNLNASESGSFLWTPKDRTPETLNASNGKVTGSFTANTVNYVGIDFKRTADASTTDLVQFLDSNTLLESGRTIPLGRTLDYVITISTSPFSTTSNIVPVAKITTDINNTITAVQDARTLMYRLGAGGDFPNGKFTYTYPFGRQEDSSNAVFTGGDKNIQSEKDWKNAIMTRMWELGGGENWYSPTADRNVRLIRKPTFQFSNGDNFILISNTQLHWQGLVMLFDNANNTGVYYNEIQDQLVDDTGPDNKTLLAVGECLYVDIDRTQNLSGANAIVAKKAAMQNLGTPAVPGSRYVIAWRDNEAGNAKIFTRDFSYTVNQTFSVATTTSFGLVEVSRANNTATPIAIATTGGTILPNSINGANQTGLTVSGLGTGTGLIVNGGTSNGTGLVVNGGATNGIAATFTGVGTGNGINATGGTNLSGQTFGVQGTSGDTVDGVGVVGNGGCTTDSSTGVQGTGGPAGGYGVTGYGGAAGGSGVLGSGTANGFGVTGTPGPSGTAGVQGNNFNAGAGMYGVLGILSGSAAGAGVRGNGGSTAIGVWGVGGSSSGSGTGVKGQGGSPNGIGVLGTGLGSGTGGDFTGGTSNGAGIHGAGGGGNAVGVSGNGSGTGSGVAGLGGATGPGGFFTAGGGNTIGVSATGAGTEAGLSATGGATSGAGVFGRGGGGGGGHGVGVVGEAQGTSGVGTSGSGVFGHALGDADGVQGTADNDGTGVLGTNNGTGSGDGVRGVSNSNGDGVSGTANGTGSGVSGNATGGGAGGSFTGNTVDISVPGSGNISFGGPQPASTTGFSNVINRKNVCKAWGQIATAASPTVGVNDGFNISTVAFSGLQYIRVTFAHTMTDNNYSVVVSMIPNKTAQAFSTIIPSVSNMTTSSFDVAFYNVATSAQINASNLTFSIDVKASQ